VYHEGAMSVNIQRGNDKQSQNNTVHTSKAPDGKLQTRWQIIE
jgi:hypothetical protein